jgi:hypothetical protein
MPIDYRVDHEQRLVYATAREDLTDQDVFGYQYEVWSREDVVGYDELVDMTHVEHIEVPSADRMKELVQLAAGMDLPHTPTKFAIVAPDRLSYDLARFFQAYREIDPRSTKQVEVFKTVPEALGWLGAQVADSS